MDFVKKTFAYKGIFMVYHEGGKGDPLIFFHGGGVRGTTYKKLIQLLSQNYHVYAPDIPPYGESDVPNKLWGLTQLGEYFNGFIKEKHIADPILVGQSLGGGVALAIANGNKEIKKVVVADSAGIAVSKFVYNLYWIYSMKKILHGLRHFNQITLLLQIYKDTLFLYIRKIKKIHDILEIGGKCIYETLDFSKISAPTLILWGEKDEIFPISSGELLQKQIKNSKLEIVDGNHDWSLFHPKKFVDFIINF